MACSVLLAPEPWLWLRLHAKTHKPCIILYHTWINKYINCGRSSCRLSLLYILVLMDCPTCEKPAKRSAWPILKFVLHHNAWYYTFWQTLAKCMRVPIRINCTATRLQKGNTFLCIAAKHSVLCWLCMFLQCTGVNEALVQNCRVLQCNHFCQIILYLMMRKYNHTGYGEKGQKQLKSFQTEPVQSTVKPS